MFYRALMTYRNTADRDTGLSPAETLYGRPLKDFLPYTPRGAVEQRRRIPMQRTWTDLMTHRETALAARSTRDHEKWSATTKSLPPLRIGDHVFLQNQSGNYPKRWDKRGVVIEVLQNHQYRLRVDGSRRVTLRNRQFLRRFQAMEAKPFVAQPPPIGIAVSPVRYIETTATTSSRQQVGGGKTVTVVTPLSETHLEATGEPVVNTSRQQVGGGKTVTVVTPLSETHLEATGEPVVNTSRQQVGGGKTVTVVTPLSETHLEATGEPVVNTSRQQVGGGKTVTVVTPLSETHLEATGEPVVPQSDDVATNYPSRPAETDISICQSPGDHSKLDIKPCLPAELPLRRSDRSRKKNSKYPDGEYCTATDDTALADLGCTATATLSPVP